MEAFLGAEARALAAAAAEAATGAAAEVAEAAAEAAAPSLGFDVSGGTGASWRALAAAEGFLARPEVEALGLPRPLQLTIEAVDSAADSSAPAGAFGRPSASTVGRRSDDVVLLFNQRREEAALARLALACAFAGHLSSPPQSPGATPSRGLPQGLPQQTPDEEGSLLFGGARAAKQLAELLAGLLPPLRSCAHRTHGGGGGGGGGDDNEGGAEDAPLGPLEGPARSASAAYHQWSEAAWRRADPVRIVPRAHA